MAKKFVGLDGLKRFWTKAKTWIAGQITAEVTSKIAEVVANAPEDFNTLKEIADWISTHADDASAMNSQIIQNQNDIKSLQSLIGNIAGDCPVGTIMLGLYATAPDGFFLCNGQEVAIADYPELYAVIGTFKECQSNNEGMFKVPDFRECVPVGTGTSGRPSTELKTHDPYELCQFKDDQFKFHNHDVSITGGEHSHNVRTKLEGPYLPVVSPGGHAYFPLNSHEKSSTEGHRHNITIYNRGGETTHGKQIGVNYIIKY